MPGWINYKLESRLKVKVAQSCPTLCDPMDYTVHGILQARIMECVTLPFSRGSSQPKDWTQVSHIPGGFFTSWTTREAQSQDCWEKHQQPQVCRCYHSNDRKWRGIKETLDEDERGEWKCWIKTQPLKKNNIMASGPITLWQIEREKVESVADFIFLGSKITANGGCSH